MARAVLVHLPSAVIIIVVIFGVVAVSLSGLWIVRRVALDERHNEVAGFIIAVVGVIYGVLLALVVVATWEQFQDARAVVDREASIVLSLYRDAQVSGAEAAQARQALTGYVEAVVGQEWSRMEDGEESRRAEEELARVWTAFLAIDHERPDVAANIADDLDELAVVRAERLFMSTDTLPAVFWAGIIVGAVITIGFTYLFWVPDVRAHAVMVLALAALIGVVLAMILVLDMPFTGDAGVGSEPLAEARTEFAHIDRQR